MKVCVRACYQKLPKYGYICISKIIGKRPVEYELKIYEESKGQIKTARTTFPDVDKARGHASLYGFLLNNWDIELKEI